MPRDSAYSPHSFLRLHSIHRSKLQMDSDTIFGNLVRNIRPFNLRRFASVDLSIMRLRHQ